MGSEVRVSRFFDSVLGGVLIWVDDDDDDDEDYEDDDYEDDEEASDAYIPTLTSRRRPQSNKAPNGRLRGWHWFPLNRTGTQVGRALARSGAFGKAGWPGAGQRVTVGEVAASPRKPLSASPSAVMGSGRRRSSVSSVKSVLTGEEGRVRGVRRLVGGRAAFVNGMNGFGRDWGRGVWGRSGFQEWNRVCPRSGIPSKKNVR